MTPPSPVAATLTAKFARFEQQWGVLFSDFLGEFRWPSQNLPSSLQAGNIVYFEAKTELPSTTAAQDEEQKYIQMRRLLEELIN
ncbi:MAG: hypothetical protein AAB588_02180 [Patescibacteria group bacterium]